MQKHAIPAAVAFLMVASNPAFAIESGTYQRDCGRETCTIEIADRFLRDPLVTFTVGACNFRAVTSEQINGDYAGSIIDMGGSIPTPGATLSIRQIDESNIALFSTHSVCNAEVGVGRLYDEPGGEPTRLYTKPAED